MRKNKHSRIDEDEEEYWDSSKILPEEEKEDPYFEDELSDTAKQAQNDLDEFLLGGYSQETSFTL